jgi:membrane fusion protein, heavy metal efflux system
MKMKSPFRACLLLCFGAIACGRKPDASSLEHAHSGEPTAETRPGQPSPDLLKIDPGMLRDLRITTVKAESRPGGEEVSVLGEVSVNEETYAEVGSAVAARAVRILASPGDTVSRGQPLVELQSVDLGRARADYWSARARAELARSNVARKRELADRVVPRREVEQAESDAAAAEADLQAAAGSLRALGLAEEDLGSPTRDDSRLVLRSPVAGTVIERNVMAGQMTEPSKPLFRVGDLSRLWLTVHAFERDAVRIHPGSAVRASFPALPGRVFTGTVTLVGRQVDMESRTIPVRIDVDNPETLLRPGMSATVFVRLGGAGGTIVAVPAASLQRMQDEWRVFVPKGEGAFEMRTVGRGRDLGGEVEIVSGLRPGEDVVVEGAFLLKAEAEKARGEGEQHEH